MFGLTWTKKKIKKKILRKMIWNEIQFNYRANSNWGNVEVGSNMT